MRALVSAMWCDPLTHQNKCRQYDAWLEDWYRRNVHRFDTKAQLWGAIQRAAMARYLARHDRYELACDGAQGLFGQLFYADGSLVRAISDQ